MEKIVKYVPITTIIIVFFFACGGLYLVGYWSTFDVDISNLVSLTEIPKSFIMPCAVAHGFFLSTLSITPILFQHKGLRNRDNTTKGYAKFWKTELKVLSIVIWFYPLVAIILWNLFKLHPLFWVIMGIVLCFTLFLLSSYINFVRNIFPVFYIRLYVTFICIFTPILSFCIGKAKAVNTYNNNDIKYIEIIKKNMDKETRAAANNVSLKLLGFLGDKAIVSSLDNKRIIILNQSNFDGIEIEVKNKGKYWPLF